MYVFDGIIYVEEGKGIFYEKHLFIFMKEDFYFCIFMKEDCDIFMIYELHIFISMKKYCNIIIFMKKEITTFSL